MPTVHRIGPYRFLFYSADGTEPPHIHIRAGKAQAKFWLAPVRFATSSGFKPHELRRIERLVIEHQQLFVEAWHEHFET